jgi:PAS domain S-box-containing protein
MGVIRSNDLINKGTVWDDFSANYEDNVLYKRQDVQTNPFGIDYMNTSKSVLQLYQDVLSLPIRKHRSYAICKCRKSINPNKMDTLLLRCSKCNKWFHAACVGVRLEDLSTLKTFDCPKCEKEITNVIVLRKMKEAAVARQNRKRGAERIKHLEQSVNLYEKKNNTLRKEILELQTVYKAMQTEIQTHELVEGFLALEKSEDDRPPSIKKQHNITDSTPLLQPIPPLKQNLYEIVSKSKHLLQFLTQILKDAHFSSQDAPHRHGSLIDPDRVMISHHTEDGVFRYSSPTCASILGYQYDELYQLSLFDLVHPDDNSVLSVLRTKKRLSTILKTSLHVIYRLKCKNGSFLSVEGTFRPMVYEGLQGFHCVAYPIINPS